MSDLNIVIFGVTGNLAEIKLIPALFELWNKEQISRDVNIFGLSQRARTQEELWTYVSKAVLLKHSDIGQDLVRQFFERFRFLSGDLSDKFVYTELRDSLSGCKGNLIYYLATLPSLYQGIFGNLDKIGLNKNSGGWVKIMIEKPIGSDYKSARNLNILLKKYYKEEQIFRIDHYLAKDTIQNILAFRFHNDVFEPAWSGKNIDHIQITIAESFGVENRNAYYDSVGALKDVGQNHALQMLVFTLMGRPRVFDNRGITSKRMGVLRNLVPDKNSLILGQYENYSKENINTNTFFAFKTTLSKGKFKDVPVYIRGGKKLAKTVAEISVVFKSKYNEQANVLVFRIQPNEGIVFRMAVKKPGFEMKCEKGTMQFCYHQIGKLNDAYVRLLMDAITGEQTYFNDAIEIESQWKFIDGLKASEKKVISYVSGSWGPKETDELINRDGRSWIEPSEEICRI
jgi:glucose-6-phosphate 1-dehydrogenase